jgi:hypothetical protein
MGLSGRIRLGSWATGTCSRLICGNSIRATGSSFISDWARAAIADKHVSVSAINVLFITPPKRAEDLQTCERDSKLRAADSDKAER